MARPTAPLLLPLLPTVATAAVDTLGNPRQQAFQRALQTLVGTQVPAQVLSRLADGSALVSVAGIPARMALPATVAAGAELSLTVAAAEPRPTFQLGVEETGAPRLIHAEATAAPVPHARSQAVHGIGTGMSMAGVAPATVRSALTTPLLAPALAPEQATAILLTPAARLISHALAQAAGQEALRPAAPLLCGADVSAAALDTALRESVDTSGLFYEAHLAQWAQGKRTLDSLRSEPQMQQHHDDAPAALQLVGRQLTSHEQQQVAWQGQLVPGLPLEWRITHDPSAHEQGHDSQDGSGIETTGAWHSTLRLRFALLGEVEASVSLHGGALQIRLETNDAETAASLRTHGASLATALAAAGLTLSGLAVVPPQASE